MSVAHDCSFVLDARLQSGDLVQDAKGGVRFGRKRATVKAGAPSFDLNESLLERDAGPLTVIPQNYTHAYWVWWRHSDAGAYRTLLRGSDDHSCAVKGRELGCAPSNRNAWPPNSPRRASAPRAAGLSPFRRYFCTRDGDTGGQFHSTGFSIRPEEGWQFVVVTGEGQTPGSHLGTSRYYLGTPKEQPQIVGEVPRVASGTTYNRIGWPGQGPGWVGQILCWSRVLKQTEIAALHAETRGRYQESAHAPSSSTSIEHRSMAKEGEGGQGATKLEIKEAVQALFGVRVEKVRTMIVRGKMKRFGRYYGKRSNWKKALVTVADGEDLNFYTGL